MNKQHDAFSIIELLVVISVIFLLIGITLPAIYSVRNNAKDTVCKSNLKQWGTIWLAFTEDNHGLFTDGNDVTYPRGQWIQALRKEYESRKELLLCPSAKRRNDGHEFGGVHLTYLSGDYEHGEQGEPASYGLNCWVYNTRKDIQGRKAENHWRTINISKSAKVPLFMDSMWRGGGPHYDNDIASEPANYNGEWISVDHEMRHFAMDRHRDGINCVFMDMTVRHIDLKELWRLKWHRNFDTKGKWTTSAESVPDWPKWMEKYKEY